MPETIEIPEPGEITRLLRGVRDGDRDAFDRLLPMVYETLKLLARRELRRRQASLCTIDLVHETYVKIARAAQTELEGRIHFYAVAARAMRQVLVDLARKRARAKRGGDRRRTPLKSQHVAFDLQLDEVLALDQALDRLDELNPRLRKVVEFRFFAGLSEKEIAELLGISERSVERDWVKARMFLYRELRSDRP